MFMWWRQENGLKDSPITTLDIEQYSQKAARLGRRGWYWSEMQLSHSVSWLNKKFASLFFSIFPNAAPAFAKKDELAGLKDGPSSYFLLTITEEQKRMRNRRRA